MSTALFNDLSSYFNNIDPEDPIYQKDLIRPAEIKEDVKLMEQRKRVTNIMRSKMFKKDLESIFLKFKFDEDVGMSASNLSLAEITEQLLLSAIPKNKVANLSQLSTKKGTICINDLTSAISSLYGKIERQYRCKLASLFRLVNMYGWNSEFSAVMTTRPFADKEQFLINPFGLMFHEVTASSLISVDFRGNILDFGSTVLEANPLAWMIHSAIYSCRNSIRAILELKTKEALAISSLEHGLLPICREAIVLGQTMVLNNLPAFTNEMKSTSVIQADLKNYLMTMIVPNLKVLIVPNCGIMICGDNIEEAWHLMMNCQIACETQLKLGNLNLDDLYIPDKSAQIDLYNQWRSTDLGGVTKLGSTNMPSENGERAPLQWRLGELEFEALMRHMDNNGYRTGYFYKQENIFQTDEMIKSHNPKVKYEVEIPPSSSSTIEQTVKGVEPEDESLAKSIIQSKTEKWFNTPNMYKLIDESGDAENNLSYNYQSVQSDKKSARWVSAKVPNLSAPTPQHPVTAGAYVAIGHHTSKSDNNEKILAKINPKELMENQKRVKNKYYHDTNTAGPMSCLLDSGLSREEARMIKNESLKKQLGPSSAPANDPVVTSGSKGIIQRGHKALVYQDLFKLANPFDVSADELANYHKEVDRKLNPDKYKSLDIEEESTSKDEAPVIKITLSQSESSPKQTQNEITDASLTRRDTEFSTQKQISDANINLPEETFECHPFFQSDFDEDFNNLNLTDTVFTSSPKKPNSNEANKSGTGTSLNMSGDGTRLKKDEGIVKSASMKDYKKKSFRSFSFKKFGRSKTAKESTELLENKAATLAAPGYGTITSETSGADVSHDELDKDAKSKKKKRKFKLPSFSKKKKDKSKQ